MYGCVELRSQAKIFLSLEFEVGVSSEKYCLWQSVNVACADCFG